MAETVWLPGGVQVEVVLDAAATGGQLCLLIDQPPPGWALPPHRHGNESETIHVVEGEFELFVDGERRELRAGDTAHVPKGVVHSGANIGSTTGRRVVVFAPAGIEGWFREVGAPAPDADVDLGALAAAAQRFGWEFVSP
jgi:mannose-6-phosphate isomerase-like protein (cupin superfamily)